MFAIYGPGFLEALEAAALKYFNAKLSIKKSFILGKVSGATVLSYLNRNGIAYRLEQDLLRHLYFPERPQDYARLAASAVGLAQASLGSHERFYHLCALIHHDLVVRRQIKPKISALRWLKRVGMDDLFDQLERGDFPTLMQLWIWRYHITDRSDNEKQKQWPTRPQEGNDQGFYFLDEL